MIKRRYLILIIVAFTFGLVIEGLKKVANLSIEEQREATLVSFKNYDLINPFYVVERIKEKNSEKTKTRYKKSKGMTLSQTESTIAEQYDFSEGHKVAQKAAGDTKEGTPTEDAKKKKKKKKNARGLTKLKKAEPKEKIDEPAEDEEESDETDDFNTGSSSVVVTTVTPPTPAEETKLPVTYQDWAKLVLGKPNPENVNKLVEYYNNGMVTNDVFYAILGAMIEESNPEQHKLAVSAAGRAPSSQSFQFLVDVLKSENQNSELVTNVNQHIANYESISAVGHLVDVLRERLNDPETIQIAVAIVDKSSQINLEDREPADESTTIGDTTLPGDNTTVPGDTTTPPADGTVTDPGTTPGDTTTPTNPDNDKVQRDRKRQNARRIFSRFIPALEQVIAHFGTNQPAITEVAQRALTRIKNITVVVAQPND